ncbi:MAG TPA: hypothetical protein VIC07_00900 [Acidimicrobiia bacterium]|jgi:hypothetical protein
MNNTVRLAVFALLLNSCSTLVGETPTQTAGVAPSTTTLAPGTTATTERGCVHVTTGEGPIATGSVSGDALAMSGQLFLCADDVVVVAESNLNEVAVGAQLAAALGGPLLHPHPQLAAELGRLKPKRVHVIGALDVTFPPEAEVLRPTIAEAVDSARAALGVSETVPLPATPDATSVVETVKAIQTRAHVVLPQTSPAVSSTTAAPAIDKATVVTGLATAPPSGSVWMVDAAQPVLMMTTAATGRVAGANVVAYDAADILGHPEVGTALAGQPPESIRFVGAVPDATEWEIGLLSTGLQVPGGGFYVFPEGQPRRYVAFYGHPETTGLGVLGEQGPQATLERMAPFVEDYAADGHQVIPTFEIIASVASAQAGEDGDYSSEWPPASFEEWIRVAGENGMYVILDLQSGREDFLSQAKLYEELLKLPFVGLALDPEWRLQGDQVHLNQVGQVNAAEVNTVVDWLADLVRDNGLPQKLLIVHQFQSRMIVDRESLKQRPELQMLIQMDGQGPIATKDETYRFLTEGQEDVHWRWGWKNFFDEDSPTPTPEYTMGKDPVPVFVSYQ